MVDMVISIGKDEFLHPEKGQVFLGLPSLQTKSSEKQCLEDEISFWGKRHIFSGQLLVSGRIDGALGAD